MKTLYQLLEEHIEQLDIEITELIDWGADDILIYEADAKIAALVALREHYNEQ